MYNTKRLCTDIHVRDMLLAKAVKTHKSCTMSLCVVQHYKRQTIYGDRNPREFCGTYAVVLYLCVSTYSERSAYF